MNESIDSLNQEPDTKERIIDAAQYLFAHNGYHATSLRAITGRAGANLASVNYHFGTKEALLESVLKRRLIPLNQIRKERIEKVLANAGGRGEKPSVRDVLLAFIEPTMRFIEETPGADDFVMLISRSFSDPDPTVRNVFLRLVMPLFHLLFKGFREALPHVPEQVLLLKVHFMFGALSHIFCCRGGHEEAFDVMPAVDSKSMMETFIPFITAGMEA
jgi:AcrR family transcriptional regulator